MNRKTLIAGLVLSGLILATVLLLRSPEKGNLGSQESARPIAKLTADTFDTLEVTKGGTTTVIKREGDDYKILSPVGYSTDKTLAKLAFEALVNMQFANLVSDQKSQRNALEVGEDSLRVVLRKGDRAVADLHIGKTADMFTMVRVEGKDEVWSTTGLQKSQLDKDLTAWRDKSITAFDEKDAEKLFITSKSGGLILLSRNTGPDGAPAPEWHVVQSSVKVEPFDKDIAGGVVSQLATWKANDFADNAKPEDAGLDAPELVVAVSLRDGKQQTVLVGKKKSEDEIYVKRAESPQIFVVKKYNLDRMNKPPIEFRDKTMCDLKSDEITEIVVTQPKDSFTLVKQDGTWKLSQPTGIALDENKAARIAGSFSEWKAQGFAEDNSVNATGLAKPVATVLAKSSLKGHVCQLQIGSETSDKSKLHVKASHLPDVFVVSKWSLARVVVKVDALKKK